MFDRLVEDFCQFDDFCQAFRPHWEARLLSEEAQPAKKRGPQPGLVDSEIMTILVLYHSSRFSNFKAFYEGVVHQGVLLPPTSQTSLRLQCLYPPDRRDRRLSNQSPAAKADHGLYPIRNP